LAQRLDEFYEVEAGRFFHDPWAARDAAMPWWLERGERSLFEIFTEHMKRPLMREEQTRVSQLLLMQRERLAMFTSCGWFFDDPSGVESVQILRHAARAIDLARNLGIDCELGFIGQLEKVPSNLPQFSQAAAIYRRLILPTRAPLKRIAAHAAILDHLELWPQEVSKLVRIQIGTPLRSEKFGLAGHDRTLSVREINISHMDTGEVSRWNVIVHRADRLDFICWLADDVANFSSLDIQNEFLKRDDDSFRLFLDQRYGASRFGLDAVLSDERRELASAFAPLTGLGPSRAHFLHEWTQAIAASRHGGRDDDSLLEMLLSAEKQGFWASNLPWAQTLVDQLFHRLEELLQKATPSKISRAMRWLDTIDHAKILQAPWRLIDFQHRWNLTFAHVAPNFEKEACRSLGERLAMAEIIREKI
jgi:hypothetical protein